MISIHAGHAPDGQLGCGAKGNMMNESTLNRMVVASMCKFFELNHVRHKDTTITYGGTAASLLAELVKRDNKCGSDLGISIHFNAANGSVQGTEIYAHTNSAMRSAPIGNLSGKIAESLGIPDRGVKNGNHLYYCNRTSQPTMLIEVAFCDAMTTDIINRLPKAAEEICRWVMFNFRTITGKDLELSGDVDVDVDEDVDTNTDTNTNTNTNTNTDTLYRVQVGAFKKPENAVRLQQELAQRGYHSFITKDTL